MYDKCLNFDLQAAGIDDKVKKRSAAKLLNQRSCELGKEREMLNNLIEEGIVVRQSIDAARTLTLKDLSMENGRSACMEKCASVLCFSGELEKEGNHVHKILCGDGPKVITHTLSAIGNDRQQLYQRLFESMSSVSSIMTNPEFLSGQEVQKINSLCHDFCQMYTAMLPDNTVIPKVELREE
uniref:Uncharacterized protein n=1 Tax=Romanomermis culicivorax TaxID=13658 RepID=A0A915I1C5_ROMCU